MERSARSLLDYILHASRESELRGTAMGIARYIALGSWCEERSVRQHRLATGTLCSIAAEIKDYGRRY